MTIEREKTICACDNRDKPYDTEPDDAQTRRPRSISLTGKPQKNLESPLGALRSAELGPELLAILIYGGNSKPL